MPNRIIKESICTSETLANISAEAERLFWRLVVRADDYGCYDGRPKTILGTCLTSLLGRFSEDDVERWLDELEDAGLILRYEVDGRPYLRLRTWDRHQQVRAKKPKYPLPPPDAAPGAPARAPASNCNQVRAGAAVRGQPPANVPVIENENGNENGNVVVVDNCTHLRADASTRAHARESPPLDLPWDDDGDGQGDFVPLGRPDGPNWRIWYVERYAVDPPERWAWQLDRLVARGMAHEVVIAAIEAAAAGGAGHPLSAALHRLADAWARGVRTLADWERLRAKERARSGDGRAQADLRDDAVQPRQLPREELERLRALDAEAERVLAEWEAVSRAMAERGTEVGHRLMAMAREQAAVAAGAGDDAPG